MQHGRGGGVQTGTGLGPRAPGLRLGLAGQGVGGLQPHGAAPTTTTGLLGKTGRQPLPVGQGAQV